LRDLVLFVRETRNMELLELHKLREENLAKAIRLNKECEEAEESGKRIALLFLDIARIIAVRNVAEHTFAIQAKLN